jgi:hypothetical protein
MLNIFVDTTNSLEISKDKHTNPIPKIIVNME